MQPRARNRGAWPGDPPLLGHAETDLDGLMLRPPPERVSLSRGMLLMLPLLGACADGLATAPQPMPAVMRMTSVAEAFYASSQSAEPGTAVAVAPAVVVQDAAGRPMAGITVRFVVNAGGGSVGEGVVLTDAAGVAGAGSWRLGRGAGRCQG